MFTRRLTASMLVMPLAAIVGHASVQTTAKYDRRGERAKEQAANNLNVAYEPTKR